MKKIKEFLKQAWETCKIELTQNPQIVTLQENYEENYKKTQQIICNEILIAKIEENSIHIKALENIVLLCQNDQIKRKIYEEQIETFQKRIEELKSQMK